MAAGDQLSSKAEAADDRYFFANAGPGRRRGAQILT